MTEIGYSLRERLGLQYLLDHMAPCSPYGAERVRRPVMYGRGEAEALAREWRNTGAMLEAMTRSPALVDRLGHLMMQLRDIRGTLRRCGETTLTEVELFEVKRFLLQLGLIAPVYRELDAGLEDIALTEEPEALALLDPEGRRTAGFAVGGAYAKELAAVREEKRLLEQRLQKTPDGPARDDLLNERRRVVAREEAEALRVRVRLTEALRPFAGALLRNTDMLGRLDFTIQKAALAQRYGGVMPRIVTGGVAFEAMRNPRVADALAEKGHAFTRVTIEAPVGATVITGANMGGKSVALKTLALNLLLCQAGFFPCADRAELPLFDAIEVAEEDLADAEAGLSSFGAEVCRLKSLLSALDGGAFLFIALDEPARGTNPREGAALVRALVERLAGARAVSVIATHYDGAAVRAQAHYQAAGLRDLPGELPPGDRLDLINAHMNYGLERVDAARATPREALTICRLLGLDSGVVDTMARLLAEGGDGADFPAK